MGTVLNYVQFHEMEGKYEWRGTTWRCGSPRERHVRSSDLGKDGLCVVYVSIHPPITRGYQNGNKEEMSVEHGEKNREKRGFVTKDPRGWGMITSVTSTS